MSLLETAKQSGREKKHMMNIKEKPEGTLLAAACLPNVNDSHLRIVLYELRGEFVTWIYNAETKGYGHGHYFTFFVASDDQKEYATKRNEAFADFIGRLAGKVGQ